jgi:hypothetical protein
MQMYWTPVNTFGYRDIEHDSDSLRGRRTAFVTGDSFVAGMGMSDYRDRFANVTGTELGSEWAVVVLAKNGWNTAQQIEALNAYPHQPDLIVLGYYVNDIEGAGFKHGYARPRLVDPPAGVLGLAVRHSYVLDVLYWRMYRFGNAQEMSAAYHAHLRRLYSDERVWTTHLVELDSVADYAADKGVPLIVLLIPWLTDVESSRPHLARVASHLAARDIPLINLVDQLVDRDPRDLVANPFDAHPSRALHSEIGRILADAIRRTAVRMEGA